MLFVVHWLPSTPKKSQPKCVGRANIPSGEQSQKNQASTLSKAWIDWKGFCSLCRFFLILIPVLWLHSSNVITVFCRQMCSLPTLPGQRIEPLCAWLSGSLGYYHKRVSRFSKAICQYAAQCYQCAACVCLRCMETRKTFLWELLCHIHKRYTQYRCTFLSTTNARPLLVW